MTVYPQDRCLNVLVCLVVRQEVVMAVYKVNRNKVKHPKQGRQGTTFIPSHRI